MSDEAGDAVAVKTEPQARHVVYCGGAVSPLTATTVLMSNADRLQQYARYLQK